MDSAPPPDDLTPAGLLTDVDPFAALADARRQWMEAIEQAEGALAAAADTTDADIAAGRERIAQSMAAVIAHDEALREWAIAFADPAVERPDVVPPAARHPEATRDRAITARYELFEAATSIAHALDSTVTIEWSGEETWRMHLIVHAMHEGLHAEALLTDGPLPPPLSG